MEMQLKTSRLIVGKFIMHLKIALNNFFKKFIQIHSFITMLRAVASAPCQKYIKDKILHVLAFFSLNSFPLCFFSESSNLPLLYLHCGVAIRSVFRTLPNI